MAAPDPVGSGFVATLAKPGGNITGFISHESSLGSKWLQLLHDVAPQVSRVAFMYNPNTAPFSQYYLAPFQSAASKLAIEAIDAPVRSPAEIEAVMNMIGRRGDAGVIIMLDITVLANRELILSLADRYRLPAVYPQRSFVTGGGLRSMASK